MKPIPSCPRYFADELGNIHGPRGELSQFFRRGYAKVQAAGKQQRVNRLVCEAYHGPSPTRFHHAAHLNGNSMDNRPDNLAWKTPAENCADIALHGSLQGEKHPRASLSEDDVRYIRAQRESGRTIRGINEEFPGIKYSTLVAIANGRNFRYV